MRNNRLLRIAALILCAAMLICVLAGCQSQSNNDVGDEDDTENTEDEETENDFTVLYKSVDPTTPVMKIGDIEITWGMMYYYFYQEATELYGDVGEVYDWTAEYSDGVTYLQYCVGEAVYDYLRYYAGVVHFANEYNVTLTDEQKATIEEDKAADLDLFDNDETAMQEYIESMYLDVDTVDRIAEMDYLYLNTMDAVVGVNGELANEDDIMVMAETAYKATKFVKLPKSEYSYSDAESVLAEVKAVAGADLESKFVELINEYCNSEELAAGYVYTRGKLDIDEVEDAVKSIEEGQYYDGVVETDDCYYIVMRTAIDLDAYPYYGEDGFGENTLRYLYRDEIFEDIFWGWADYVDVEYYDILTEFDIDAVLGWS